MRKPDLLIVGAPRAATTSMQDYLREHPQIFVPLWKEVHFFGADLTKRSEGHWFVVDEAKYLALFDMARDDQAAGEASAMYLYSKTAAQEIKRFNPDTKIIIQLRNPIDVMYSHHGHLVWSVNEDIEDFEAALLAEEDRRQGRRIPRCAILPEALLYRETVRFVEQVQRYLTVFGRENVHVIIYDDLRADNAGCYRRTLEFLGVDPSFKPDFQLINQHKRVRSRFLQALTMKPPRVLNGFMQQLPDHLRYVLLGKIQMWNSVQESRPPMSPELRRRLAVEFQSEVERLSALLDRDLMHWVTC